MVGVRPGTCHVRWASLSEAPFPSASAVRLGRDVTEDEVGEVRSREGGIGRTERSPAWVGSVSGSLVGSSGLGARTGQVEPAGRLDGTRVVEREGITREAVDE